MLTLDFYVSQHELQLTSFMVIFVANMRDLPAEWRHTTFVTGIAIRLNETLTAYTYNLPYASINPGTYYFYIYCIQNGHEQQLWCNFL